MKKEKLKDRLDLLARTRLKVESMEKRNVFSLDINAMQLLIELHKEFKDLLSENLELKKEIKILSFYGKKKKNP